MEQHDLEQVHACLLEHERRRAACGQTVTAYVAGNLGPHAGVAGMLEEYARAARGRHTARVARLYRTAMSPAPRGSIVYGLPWEAAERLALRREDERVSTRRVPAGPRGRGRARPRGVRARRPRRAGARPASGSDDGGGEPGPPACRPRHDWRAGR